VSTSSRRLRTLALTSVIALSCRATALAEPMLDEGNDVRGQRYANTRWSKVMPDGGFEDGCASGYMTFQLKSNGFFIFNNRITGIWSASRPDMLFLRTRQGLRFFLQINEEESSVGSNLPFARKNNVFRRCSE
jgi:hypothetical protein